jgi:glucan phosphorylase
MSTPTRLDQPLYSLLPTEVEGFDALAELALDLRWSWNHGADQVWRRLDPALWELTHNPWALLQTVSRERVERLLADTVFRQRIEDLLQAQQSLRIVQLEREVIPEFYARDHNGIPIAWVARMRSSMARLTPRFSTNRAVREYTEQHYLPAATAYRERAADKGALGVQIMQWRRTLDEKWAALSFGEVSVVTVDAQRTFEVEVHLDALEPGAVRVELYADNADGGLPVRQEMGCIRPLPGAAGGYVYGTQVPATRPATDYTARIMAHRVGVAVPLEAEFILWQR